MWIINWFKSIGAKTVIKQMDELEQPFAAKIREAQKRFGTIQPEAFAKEVVDSVQWKLCEKFGVDPASIGL